jgi:hypothetical protein
MPITAATIFSSAMKIHPERVEYFGDHRSHPKSIGTKAHPPSTGIELMELVLLQCIHIASHSTIEYP